MKRWRERGYDPDQDDRDETAHGPLRVEPIDQRSASARYGLPAAAAAFVLVALLVAMVGPYVTYFMGPAATPALPTPIAWVNTTASPTAATDPTPDPLPVPGQPTPTPVRRISIAATIQVTNYYWPRGTANHFTVQLTNRTPGAISLNPCPAYRMYTATANKFETALRLLNCAAIGQTLQSGQSVDLDMVYTPTVSDALGDQTLVWSWETPDAVQAIATGNAYIVP